MFKAQANFILRNSPGKKVEMQRNCLEHTAGRYAIQNCYS
jgi:hypothetical protein